MSKSVIFGQNLHQHKFFKIWATKLHLSLEAGICLNLQTKEEQNGLYYFLNLEIMTTNNLFSINLPAMRPIFYNEIAILQYVLKQLKTIKLRFRTFVNKCRAFQNVLLYKRTKTYFIFPIVKYRDKMWRGTTKAY